MMKICIIFSLAVVTIGAISDEQQWISFKLNHKKSYRSALEDNLRFGIFQNNLRRIEDHNRKYETGQSSFRKGVNQFADLTREEFLQKLNLQKKTKPDLKGEKTYFVADPQEAVPASFDWTERGVVTEVKDQGVCGSCWAFSATGSLESQLFLATGNLISLSNQNLLDCTMDAFGCGGGMIDSALEYIKNNGIMTEESYPYEGRNGVCRYDASQSVTTISYYVNIKKNDEQDLLHAVATVGPVSVAIDASGFQLYQSGILDDTIYCRNTDDDLDHGVLVVGYGSENGKDYWLAKNSWGRFFGENGYIRMSRNANNQCGIATDALYPQLNPK